MIPYPHFNNQEIYEFEMRKQLCENYHVNSEHYRPNTKKWSQDMIVVDMQVR